MKESRYLIVNKISKVFNGKHKFNALMNINLSFSRNGLVFIKGDNGSGKSTLLQIMAGEEMPSTGTVSFEDCNIYGRFNDKYRGSICSLVFQDLNLIEDLTIYENICLLPALNKLKNKQKLIEDALQRLGFPDNGVSFNDLLKYHPSQLSKGQQQRVAIARSLISNPSVLLLDEPSSSLDENNKALLFQVLKNYSKSHLVIIVTHDSFFEDDMPDRLIVLEHGTVIKDNVLRIQEIIDPMAKSIGKTASLSFINTLKMSLITLRFRKIFLITSILLSIFCFTGLATILTINVSDTNEIVLRAQSEDDSKETFIEAKTRISSNRSGGFEDKNRVF